MSDLTFVPAPPRSPAEDPVSPVPLPHYVSAAPYDPYAVERMTPAQERFYVASQWRMVWWKLRRHHVAVAAGGVLLAMYLGIIDLRISRPLRGRHPQHRLHLRPAAIGTFVLRRSASRSLRSRFRLSAGHEAARADLHVES